MKSHGYLIFTTAPTPVGIKTEIRLVRSLRSLEVLGLIRWYGRWRQYVFAPSPGTIFNPGCMDAINVEIRSMMAARKK